MQRTPGPIVTERSTGASAVARRTETSAAYPIGTSQFRVVDQCACEEILRQHIAAGGVLENFQPPSA